MTTAASLINRAYALIGVLGEGETLTGEQSSSGLEALNAMLDEWRLERLMCYALQREVFNLVGGQASYTIGSAGNFNTTRPVSITGAFVRDNNIDYQIDVVGPETYRLIPDKATSTNYPEMLYYEANMPLGIVYFWPVPSSALSIYLETRRVITEFATTSTDLDLAPGYENAIIYNLAIDLSDANDRKLSETIVARARITKQKIKRSNAQPIRKDSEVAGILTRNQSSYSRIVSGL